ncbi:DUF3842 family protein [Thermincola ferriacetica]
MRIAVIDGQGGGFGKYIVERLRKELPEETEIIALGTNAMATSAMLKAGANEGASGENAIVCNANKVDLIIGTIFIIVANSMLGELTPRMAEAIASSPAPKLLLPVNRAGIEVVGAEEGPLPHLLDRLMARLKNR